MYRKGVNVCTLLFFIVLSTRSYFTIFSGTKNLFTGSETQLNIFLQKLFFIVLSFTTLTWFFRHTTTSYSQNIVKLKTLV